MSRYEGEAGLQPKLDACNGHIGPVPANRTYGILESTVYHYHTTGNTPPFILGCFGLAQLHHALARLP
jgi:hypothetical protein